MKNTMYATGVMRIAVLTLLMGVVILTVFGMPSDDDPQWFGHFIMTKMAAGAALWIYTRCWRRWSKSDRLIIRLMMSGDMTD